MGQHKQHSRSNPHGSRDRFAFWAAVVCLCPIVAGGALGAGKGKGGGSDPDPAPVTTTDLGGTGELVVNYFDNSGVGSGGVKSLDDVDWSATPPYTGRLQNFDFANGHLEFHDGAPTNEFAIQADGSITVPSTGVFTLTIDANDGAGIWIDNVQVALKDGRGSGSSSGDIALSAGTYPFRLRYYDHNGAHYLNLQWSGPGIDGTEIVPFGAFDGTIDDEDDGDDGDDGDDETASGRPGPGDLEVAFYEGVSAFDAVTDIDWSAPDSTATAENARWEFNSEPLADGVAEDNVAWRTRGTLIVPSSGEYEFRVSSEHSAQLAIDGSMVADRDASHSWSDTDSTISLDAGRVRFEAKSVERGGDQGLVVWWKRPGDSDFSVIPASAFDPWEQVRMTAWNEADRDKALIIRLKRKAVREGLLDSYGAAYDAVDTLDEALALFGTDRVETALAE